MEESENTATTEPEDLLSTESRDLDSINERTDLQNPNGSETTEPMDSDDAGVEDAAPPDGRTSTPRENLSSNTKDL